jgi:hypothetical protein
MKREFKAVRLTLAILSMFIILWLPHEIGRGMQLVGNTQSYVSYLVDIGASSGMFNSSFNWLLYAGVSRTYQKTFKRLLISGASTVARFCGCNRSQD